jgi:hypothetical protein
MFRFENVGIFIIVHFRKNRKEKMEKKEKYLLLGRSRGGPQGEVLVPSPKQSLAPKTALTWIPPSTEIAEINVDAAVSRNEEQGVAAAFCRDSFGNYLGALML